MVQTDSGLPQDYPQGEQGPHSEDQAVSEFAERREFDRRSLGRSLATKFGRTNILLIALFAAGAASVYFLYLRGGPAPASASDQATEQKVSSFIERAQASRGSPEAIKTTRTIIEEFYHYASRIQIPLSRLKGNPFVFAITATEAQSQSARPLTEDAQARARAKALAEAGAELRTLKLQSILLGPRGATAIINDNFVRQGQQVGRFMVTAIDARSVSLVWEDQQYRLQMD